MARLPASLPRRAAFPLLAALLLLSPVAAAAWSTRVLATFQQWNGWDIAVGDGDRDGRHDVYLPAFGLWQVRWTGASWQKVLVGNASTDAEILSVAVGDGDRNGRNEVYAGDSQGRVWKFSWTGSGWYRMLAGRIGTEEDDVVSVSVGDADNDGLREVYALRRHHIPNGPNPPPMPPGHVFKLWLQDGVWRRQDLGATLSTFPQMLWIGDGDRAAGREIYLCDSGTPVRFKLVSGLWRADRLDAQADGCDSLAVGDIDANGQQEVYVMATFEVHRFIRDPGGWRKDVLATSPALLRDITLQDVDRDGRMEGYALAWGNGHLYKLHRGATWRLDDLGGSGRFGLGNAAGDADGDGRREVYTYQVLEPGSHNGAVQWRPT
jgi:hypothetical protein